MTYRGAYNQFVTERKAPKWASRIIDPRESPRYSIPEAAGYLGIPKATLDSWVFGRRYKVADGDRDFEPLIFRPDPDDSRLSFSNLIEAHALRALRVNERVPMKFVRTAIEYAQKKHQIDRLLLSDKLRTIPGEALLQHLDELVNIGRNGQGVMKEIVEAFLKRVDRDIEGLPARIYPFSRSFDLGDTAEAPKLILLDPKIGSGRPILVHKAVRTEAIVARFDVGEKVASLAEDYGLTTDDVEEAIRYERRRQQQLAA